MGGGKVVESGRGTKLIMGTFFLAAQAEVEGKKVPKGEGQRCNLSLLSCIEVQHSERGKCLPIYQIVFSSL